MTLVNSSGAPSPQSVMMKALDLLLDVICIVDLEGRFVAVSAACEQVFGYTPEEMIGRQMIEMVLPADRERTLQAAAGVMAGSPLRNFENRYVRKDGQVVDIMWSARWSEADQLRIAVAREVTQRKRAESMQAALYGISEAAHSAVDLPDLCRRIHLIIDGMLPTGNFFVVLHDAGTGQMTFPYFVDECAPAPVPCKPDCGILATEVIRTGTALLLTPETASAWPSGMTVDAGVNAWDWLGVPLVADQRTIGALVVQSHWEEARYSEQHKTLLQFVSTQIADHIERKQANERLQFLAQYDALTGLPNRTLFTDRLRVALARAARDKANLALLYIDLDDFKPVNDRFGHAAGDLLLQEVANRILGCVRDSDTVGRIGGDEFIVLLGAIRLPEDAARVAEHIRAAIREPVALSGHSVQVSSSIGIAVYPGSWQRPGTAGAQCRRGHVCCQTWRRQLLRAVFRISAGEEIACCKSACQFTALGRDQTRACLCLAPPAAALP